MKNAHIIRRQSRRIISTPIHRDLTRWLSGAVLSLGFLSSGYGAIVAGWDFNPVLAGGASPLGANTFLPNETVGGLTRGSGLTSTGTGGADRGFGTASWNTAVDAAAAVANNDFITFTIAPSAGYMLSLDSFSLFQYRRSATGPTNGTLQFQIGTGAYSDITTLNYTSTSTSGASLPLIDLTGIPALQNVAPQTTVTFRISNYGATSTAGTFYLFDAGTDPGVDDFVLNGTLGLVPAMGIFFGTTGQGVNAGSTVFDTTTLDFNPTNDGLGTARAFDSSKTAVFGGTAGTVTVGTVTANAGLQFTTTGYTLNSGALTLGTVPTVDVTTVGAVGTINSAISGAAGLTKIGPGILALGGINDFTGTATISAGTLKISTDENLGNQNNAIVLVAGGTLQVATDVALSPLRALSGSGGIDVAAGKTLTLFGVVTATALTLPSAGTLDLQNPTNAINGLTISAAATLTGAAVSLPGDITATQSAGTATIANPLNFGGTSGTIRVLTVADGSAPVDLLLSGDIVSASRLSKRGPGTLRLTGNNGGVDGLTGMTGGTQLGVAGTAPIVGGRLVIGNKYAIGSGSLQFNDGTLEAESDLTGTNALPVTLSLGAGQVNSATFTGSDIEITGAVSMFRATGVATGYAHRITVQNHLTFSGSFNASTGSGGTIPLLRIDGSASGVLTLAAASNAVAEGFVVDGPTLVVAGSLSADFVTVNSGALRAGNGSAFHTIFAGDGVGSSDATLAFNSATPGTSTVSTGLSLGSDATLQIRINSDLGLIDTFSVAGGITLGDAAGLPILSLNVLGSTPLALGTEFTFLNSQTAADPFIGTFRNLADLAQITSNGTRFEIDYNAGPDLNDTILRVIPEPSSILLLNLGVVLLGLRRKRA